MRRKRAEEKTKRIKRYHKYPTGLKRTCHDCDSDLDSPNGTYCRKCFNLKNASYREARRNDYNQRQRDYTKNLRDLAFENYGTVCACCGIDERLFLTIDHIANNGSEHRRQINASDGNKIFQWLREQNYPEGFQTLCRNCNWGKYRLGKCPCS